MLLNKLQTVYAWIYLLSIFLLGIFFSGISFLGLFLLFYFLIAGIVCYRKKSIQYSLKALVWFPVFCIGVWIATNIHHHVQVLPIVFIIEEIYIMAVAICFMKAISTYKSIIKKQHKTKEDIKKRQRLIHRISYLLAISWTSVPYLFLGWGILSIDIVAFVGLGLPVYLFIFVVLSSDNILNRIASEIYVYDDVKDLDKFCLYLRSFNIDNNKEEKLICKMTRNLYPVYAIGDPNTILQPNGAERVYLADEIWQDAVIDLCKRSKLILLRIGQTDGTIWEITNIINSNLIKKVIFIAYNHEDYMYFSTQIYEKMGIGMPTLDFSVDNPNAFYFIGKNESWEVKHFRITTRKDVENMLNEYLKTSPELDKEYEWELDLRNHSLKYMFDKSRIPESVRKSLNWSVFFPYILQDWTLTQWGIFVVVILLSVVTKNAIPLFSYFLLLFLFGNRIQWAVGGWSCASHFLRQQRRKQKLIFFSLVLNIFFALVYKFYFGY